MAKKTVAIDSYLAAQNASQEEDASDIEELLNNILGTDKESDESQASNESAVAQCSTQSSSSKSESAAKDGGNHGQSNVVDDSVQEHGQGQDKKLTKCEHCNKTLQSNSSLKKHQLLMHQVKFRCEYCNKLLRNPGTLRSHQKKHAAEKRKKNRKRPCNECGLVLSSSFSLKRHQDAKHNKDTTVRKCKKCRKTFKKKIAYSRHVYYAHQLKEKYQCRECEKKFKLRQSLKDHLKLHNGGFYPCSYCVRCFRTRSNMYRHRKRQHPKEWARIQEMKAKTKEFMSC